MRSSVQWREPHDPTMPESDYRVPVAPLRLQLVKQRDPSGEKYGSDEIDLIAESEGLPARLQIEPAYGIYEHSLEVDAARPTAGTRSGSRAWCRTTSARTGRRPCTARR